VQVIYLFIYYENHTQSTVIKKKRQEIHWSMLNAHWAYRKAISPLQSLYTATPALAATVESLVTDVQYPVLIIFPIIAQRSKDAH